MKDRGMVVGTGYVPRKDADKFAALWHRQVIRSLPDKHREKIFVIHHGEPDHNPLGSRAGVQVVRAKNLGHVHDLIGIKDKPPTRPEQELCGWSASVMLLAMLAYNCERDLLYVEQDCLLFGQVSKEIVAQAQREKRVMLFGSCKIMGAAQSLFWVKHEWLTRFVAGYLNLWPDNCKDRRPENKFEMLEKDHAGVGRFNFGVDRDRPLPWEAPVWYAQQWKPHELDEAKKRKLL